MRTIGLVFSAGRPAVAKRSSLSIQVQVVVAVVQGLCPLSAMLEIFSLLAHVTRDNVLSRRAFWTDFKLVGIGDSGGVGFWAENEDEDWKALTFP